MIPGVRLQWRRSCFLDNGASVWTQHYRYWMDKPSVCERARGASGRRSEALPRSTLPPVIRRERVRQGHPRVSHKREGRSAILQSLQIGCRWPFSRIRRPVCSNSPYGCACGASGGGCCVARHFRSRACFARRGGPSGCRSPGRRASPPITGRRRGPAARDARPRARAGRGAGVRTNHRSRRASKSSPRRGSFCIVGSTGVQRLFRSL